MGEVFISFIKVFTIIMGVALSLGYFPQAYKVYKNKSSKDISLLAFVVFSLGTLTWFIYGLVFNDLIIILGFAFGVIGSWLVLILSLIYRKKRK